MMSRFQDAFDKILSEDANVAGLGGVFDGGSQTNLGGAMTPLSDVYATGNHTLPYIVGVYDRNGNKRRSKKKKKKNSRSSKKSK